MSKSITDKENQHYVPKFYLRFFSFENNNKQIGIFNKDTGFYFKTAKLKTQGSKKYFYGKDGLVEDFLGDIENHLTPILKSIIDTEQLPEMFSVTQVDILMFLILMDLRNPVRKEQYAKSTELMKERILSKSKNPKEKIIQEIEEYQQKDTSHQRQILSANKSVPYCIDLNFKLLKNETKTPFITSDNPFIKYNQFMELRKYEFGSHNGYGTVGEQFMFPLNEKYLLLFYDTNIYKVGNKKEKTIILKEEKDIDQLNLMQYLNSTQILYFNENISEHYLNRLKNKATKYKNPNETYLKVYSKEINGSPDKFDELLFIGITDLKINLKLNKIKILGKANAIKFDNHVVQLRERVKEYREYKRK